MIRSHTISPCPFSYQGKQINYFLWCRQHKVTWPSAVKLWNVSFGSQLFYHRATPQSCLQLHFPACKRHWAVMFHSARAAMWGSQHWTMSTANAHSHPPHPSLGTASFFLSMRHADWYPCDPCDPAAPATALSISMDVLPSHSQADPWPKPNKPTRFTEQSWKNH